ncbi:HAD-IA family hydrolase [Bacillus paranthracis]|uniref:HAD family hydrolase n=1 Tax=Bacillus TaxID=1386 RepID=UPI0022E5A809|nr:MULTISPECIES: HAD-IA family hydrolase [Bacillus cereus group]MDA1745331.1 HAD-IA family hydrolase [Bacillus cereus group sp. LD121LC]MDK7421071.1 HAD-IA family hydrolase [Bacillus paranthracis]MDK7431650.1 HAD-IA family hydrolase [Bacillus paranthracis]MDK7517552.1 HAD-IA family hydrolase [Bacillus paranthracis]MDK7574083.1 HAD-IA family hydrolase [Bacillus paranthracis]
MIKAVIFDLDDTLISEKKYIESGYKHIAKLLSEKLQKDEQELYQLLMDLFNENARNVFNRVFDTFGVSYNQNDIMQLVEEYRNHTPIIQFFEDVLPCLKNLRVKGIGVGIITDGYANGQRQKLRALKADNYFDEIIVTDELGRQYWKPHSKAFEIMQEKLNVKFDEMLYVGDNPEKDFYISNIHPIKTIRIYRNGVYKNREYFSNIKEHYSIYGLEELDLIVR